MTSRHRLGAACCWSKVETVHAAGSLLPRVVPRAAMGPGGVPRSKRAHLARWGKLLPSIVVARSRSRAGPGAAPISRAHPSAFDTWLNCLRGRKLFRGLRVVACRRAAANTLEVLARDRAAAAQPVAA